MLYHLDGKITDLTPDTAVVDCGGIGFSVSVTASTVSALSIGEKRKIYVTEAIGEDHFDLYGFLSVNEKKWFQMLTSVSGIGPKAAMSILSFNTPDAVTSAIINDNEKVFTACPGIGKKTAQRIILELKDKISKSLSSSEKAAAAANIPVSSGGSSGSAYNEAITALNVLGYSTGDIVPVLKQINTEGMNTQEIIREVLKFMI